MSATRILPCLFLLLYFFSVAQQPKLVLPRGHTLPLSNAIYSPDGKKILTISFDRTAKLWDATTGKLLTELIGHRNGITTAAFSPDSKKVLTGAFDNMAIIWDVATSKFITILKGHLAEINSVMFSQDGQRAVTASYDKTARIWDAKSGELLVVIKGHTDELNMAAFSPDGKKLITASSDSSARIWDAVSGQLITVLRSHTAKVNSATFSPDGNMIVTASLDGTAMIWNAKDGKLAKELKGHENGLTGALFDPLSKYVLTTSYDNTAKTWDARTGKFLQQLSGHSSAIISAGFSPNGKMIVTASYDSTARVWDVLTGKQLTILKGHTNQVNSASFSPNSKNIITGSGDNTARVWEATSGALIANLRNYTSVCISAAYSPDGKNVVTCLSDNTIKTWNVSTGTLSSNLKGNTDLVASVSFSPDGEKMVFSTYNYNSNVIIWETASGNQINVLKGHTDGVVYAAFSPKGDKIVTTSFDRTAKIWDAQTGKMLMDFKGHKNGVVKAAFSPDGRHIATASLDKTAKIWDTQTGGLLKDITGHSGAVISVSFSPDGNKIATASLDSSAKIWDVKTASLQKEIRNNSYGLELVYFSPHGKKIILVFTNGEIKIWNTDSDILLSNPDKFYKYFPERYSPDKKRIIKENYDGTNEIWDLEKGEMLYHFFSLDSIDYFAQIPEGYYQTTPAAAKLLHYVTNDLKVITFEQLDVKYNRPDKVLEAIGNTDTALIKSYRKAWEKRIKKLGIDTMAFRDGYSVPEADFVNRDNIEYEQKTGTLQLHIKGMDSNYKLDRFNVWVNESPLFGQRGIKIKRKNSNSIDTIITIKLSQGENRIETSITNANGTESYRIPLYVKYTPAIKQKETLHFIGIGIDKFSDNKYNLQYSTKDIRDLSRKLKGKYKDLIIIDTLFNENVTVSNVKALKQKLHQTTVNDKVIVTYSGHGMLSKEYDYYLSTYSVNFEKPEENGLPYDELENLLDSIPARKKLMLIDACHSGEVDKDELTRIDNINKTSEVKGLKPVAYMKEGQLGLKNSFELMQSLFVNVGKSTGATIISAAAGTQFALERGDLKNGVFTYSILEAMDKNPTMKISELKKIVGERVEQLTNGLQKPTSRNETIAVDWSLW